MNILILTGSFGMGHDSCAVAIKQEISNKYTDSHCVIEDINKYMFPVLYPIIYRGFNIIVHKCHHMYNVMYKVTERQTKIPLKNIFICRIHRLVQKYSPDIVISTLPMSSKFISEYKSFLDCELPLMTCITDISIHSSWINSNTNIYFVATQSNKYKLIEKGINEKNIYIIGIPVKENFKKNSEEKKTEIKKILIMGGGLGIIPFTENLYQSLNELKDVKVTIISGKNKKIFNKLNGKYPNIEVIDYSDKVYQYMQESDIIISKAGGITLFEAIYSQLPMLVICPFLEQEIENAHFIEDQGIGKVIWDKEKNFVTEIYDLINDKSQLYEMRHRMKNIKIELDKTKMVSVIEKFYMMRS